MTSACGWYPQYIYARLRVKSVDTAALRDARPALRRAAARAKERARELMLERYALVRTDKGKKTFDRLLADVWIPAPAGRAPEGVRTVVIPRGHRWWSYADLVVAEGHARRDVEGVAPAGGSPSVRTHAVPLFAHAERGRASVLPFVVLA